MTNTIMKITKDRILSTTEVNSKRKRKLMTVNTYRQQTPPTHRTHNNHDDNYDYIDNSRNDRNQPNRK